MTDHADILFRFALIMPQDIGNRAQHPLRHAVGADADLKTARAEPGLVQCPAVADFAENLRLVHAAVFKDQFAWFGTGDGRDAADDAITRRAGIDKKQVTPSRPLVPGSRANSWTKSATSAKVGNILLPLMLK